MPWVKVLDDKPIEPCFFPGTHMVERLNKRPQTVFWSWWVCTYAPTHPSQLFFKWLRSPRWERVFRHVSNVFCTLLVNTGRIRFFIYILQPVDVAVLREAVVCITTVENSKSSISYMLQFQGEEKPLLVERRQGIGPGMEVTFEIKDHTTSFP